MVRGAGLLAGKGENIPRGLLGSPLKDLNERLQSSHTRHSFSHLPRSSVFSPLPRSPHFNVGGVNKTFLHAR